jgi:hypothetical protein
VPFQADYVFFSGLNTLNRASEVTLHTRYEYVTNNVLSLQIRTQFVPAGLYLNSKTVSSFVDGHHHFKSLYVPGLTVTGDKT